MTSLGELELAMLEIERMWPPLVFNLHGVKRTFEFHNVEVPAGEFVCYSPFHTGRMPELWEAPEEFRPERHRNRSYPVWQMVGFGGGHRPCIGKRFAKMEANVVAATIYRSFDLEILPGRSEERVFNPAMHRKHGLPARVRRR
jgi:cytochrome P450